MLFCCFSVAKEEAIDYLEWQLPGAPSLTIRLRSGNRIPEKAATKRSSFTGEITVSGQTGQPFTLCAQNLSTEGFSIEATSTSHGEANNNIHILSLTNTTGRLIIETSTPCPEGFNHQYPFVSEQHIRSTKPFLMTGKRERRIQGNPDGGFVTPVSPATKPQNLLSFSGGGFDSDDHSDFKHPPFMPVPDKAMANLVLLPTLNLPDNWREYLPLVGLYHWLMDTEPDGVTILIRFDHLPPVTFRISPAEFRELAENLLNIRQLLHWLAPRLSGREHLIQQLLALSSAEYEYFLPEETMAAIQRQLAIVLEQPDTDFSLEFEYSELTCTFTGQEQTQQPPGIIQLGGIQSKTIQSHATSEGTKGQSQSNSPAERQGKPDQNKQSQRFDTLPERDNTESGFEELSDTPAYYILKVCQTEYRINRQQVLTHLNEPVSQTDLRLLCLDCQHDGIPLQDIMEHAENNQQSQCEEYRESINTLPAMDNTVTVLQIMFRFGAEDSLEDLLQQPNLPITVDTLRQVDQGRRTQLHDLAQYAPESVIKAFAWRFKQQMQPEVLQAEDCCNHTPLYYLLRHQPEALVQELFAQFAEEMNPQSEWVTKALDSVRHAREPQYQDVFQAEAFLSHLPDDVLDVIFKQLSPQMQRALSAASRRLRNYYYKNIFLKSLKHYYFNHWTKEAVQKVEHSLAGQQDSYNKYLHRAGVSTGLIEACQQDPLYPLALLRRLSERGVVDVHAESYVPQGEQFTGSVLAALPDNHLVSARGNTLILWDIETGPYQTVTLDGSGSGDENISALAVLSDDRLAVGYTSGAIKLCDIEKKTHDSIKEANAIMIESLTQGHDGWLVSADRKFFALWDVETGDCKLKINIQDEITTGERGVYFLLTERLRYHRFCIVSVLGKKYDGWTKARSPHNLEVTYKALALLHDGSLLSLGYNLVCPVPRLNPCTELEVFQDGRLAFLLARQLTFIDVENNLYKSRKNEIIPDLWDIKCVYFSALAALPDGRVALAGTENSGKGFILIFDVYYPRDKRRTYWQLLTKELLAREEGLTADERAEVACLIRSAEGIRRYRRRIGVKDLLQTGEFWTHKDSNGHSALHYAVYSCEFNLFKTLLDRGLNPYEKDAEGNSLLMYAAEESRWDIVMELLERGANVNTRRKNNDNTPLQLAAYAKRMCMVKELLARKAKINIGSPVAFAVAGGHFGVVKMLLEHGADPNKTRFPETPLEEATTKGYSDIVKILLEYGATPATDNSESP